MKKILMTVLMTVMAGLACAQESNDTTETYKRLTGIPKPPVAGQAISFSYHPQGGPLDGMKDLVALVYMYSDYRWTLGDTALTPQADGTWKGTFQIPADCAFMAFQFQSTWDQFAQVKDNNDNQGFLYVVSDGTGQPLPGGNLAWGMMRRPSAGLGVSGYFNNDYKDIDRDALYFWYQKEIQQNQDKADRFFPTMMSIVEKQTGERYPEAAEMFFSIFSKQGTPSERNLIEMEHIYRFKLKNVQKADSVHQVILATYPDGWTVRRTAFDNLRNSGKDFHRNSVALLKKWPMTSSAKLDAFQPFIYYNAYRALATDYFTGEYPQQELIEMIPDMDFKTLAELYRTTCGAFHTKKAVSDDLNLPVAQALIAEMLKKANDCSYCEGIYLSPSQSGFLARRLLDEHLGNYADILLAKGQPTEALKQIGLITPKRQYQTPEVNETHIRALQASGQESKVADVMKQAIAQNAATPAMMDALKQSYVKQHGSEQGYEEYLNSLKPQDEVAALKAEIQKRLIKEPYKAFTLKDMDGRTVSSGDWKGKVVVLDFWASWCFPCKNSFPGMQMAVDHFKDDPNVLFYFIDTMEHGDGYEQKARDYMAEKGFTFNVLFDAKADPSKPGNNQVVFSQMNAINHSMAIPRKMIIKDGYVRLTEEGYGGSPSRLADEVTYAIEMLKQEK